jgi:hypothetical protein
MTWSINEFAATRTHLFHLTAAGNLEHILGQLRLDPASVLMRAAGLQPVGTERRKQSIAIQVGGKTVWIRDQAPLHPGNAQLQGGWTFQTLVDELNQRVFFWPGSIAGPIKAGRRHFANYQREDCRVIRI